jgi:isopentenyl-diphosphate delta-isomerase
MVQQDFLLKGVKQRKLDHLRICLDEDIDYNISNGFEEYRFMHNALPEINKDDIDLSVRFLGKKMSCPLMIAPISGGVRLAKKLNQNLAEAARELNIAMSVGSQRVMVEHPETASTFKIRDIAPGILLFANLGAVQLNNGFGIEECRNIVDAIDADALVLHLNPLQEAIQDGGNTNYEGLLDKIKELVKAIHVPVIAKEVGCGISYEVAKKLYGLGVEAVDIAGSGGTSWAAVEGYRNSIGNSFRDWGISTAEAVRTASYVKDMKIIASGGIRTGIDIAKAIALGADVASIARPLLRPALMSADSVIEEIRKYVEELRIAMFCLGAKDIEELKTNNSLVRVA